MKRRFGGAQSASTVRILSMPDIPAQDLTRQLRKPRFEVMNGESRLADDQRLQGRRLALRSASRCVQSRIAQQYAAARAGQTLQQHKAQTPYSAASRTIKEERHVQ